MKLKEYLERKKLTERQLALSIGISQQHLNRLINRASNPSLPLAKKIQDVTKGKVTIEELLNTELPSRISKKRKKRKKAENT